MISLLLLCFAVQLAIHLINTFGAKTVNEILWTLFQKLPTSTSKDIAQVSAQRREVIRLKRELASVSAQDEFSKWAKLNRQHDKAAADYEKSAERIKSTRATFDRVTNTLRWGGTTGLRYVLQFWYSKQPMFWIPQGWVPGYVEWILSFPRAPIGSVSMQVWWIACASVIALVSEGLAASIVLVSRHGQAQPMKMKASTSDDKARKEL